MKFKKMKAILTASALAATVFVSAGCGRTTKADEERNLEKKLEEKYGEEFTVIESYISDPYWWDDSPGSLDAVCSPNSDPDLFFEVCFGLVSHALYTDNYVQVVAARDAHNEMEEYLSQYYDDFFLDVHIYDFMDEFLETQKYPQLKNIPELTFEKYADAYKEEMRLSYDIVFNANEINPNDFESVCEKLAMYFEKFDNIQAGFLCYYSDSETIEEYRKEEETDYWDSRGPRLDPFPHPEYLYRLEDNKFYLSRIRDDDGFTDFEADESPKTVNMKKYDLMKKLEEKYGEEFIVLESNYSTDDAQSTLEATCCPKDDESMVFEATYSLADDAVLNDNYIQLVLEKKINADLNQFLSDNCDNYFARAYVSKLSDYDANSANYAGFTSADDVTISSYEEMYGEKMEVTFYVVLDHSDHITYRDVGEILDLYSKQFKVANISYHCYITVDGFIGAAKDISERENSNGYDILSFMKSRTVTDYLFKHEKDKGFYLFKVYEYRSEKEIIKDGSEFYESEE